LGVVTDITDLKMAQEALITSEERLRHVIASISGHIYVTELSQSGPPLNAYISPNVKVLTGYSVEKFTDNWHFWPSLIHPEDQAVAANQVAQFSQGQDSEVEYRLMRANGEVIWVRDSGRVEKTSEEHQTWIVYGVVTDITAHKQVEETLRLARDEALEANRLKTQLLAKVSHELRTPLTTILGFAEMLEFGIYGKLAERQQEAITDIIAGANYLRGLVNELLDQAQLEAGKLKLDLHLFTPADMIADIQTKMNVLAQNKGLSLKTEIAPDLPPVLFGDFARIQQILVNLVSNAIKFTRQGHVQIRFYQAGETQWALEVSDSGSGIPLEAQTYIFEPFQQVDGSITREHGGSGLGLSIVKQLTTLMAGHVALKSKEGQGSMFTVFLPLHPGQEDKA
jgi:PAS domain S-box-containing protein